MHAQHRTDRFKPLLLKHRQVIQVVPAARLRLIGAGLNRGGGGHLKPVRVAGVNARPLLRVVCWLGFGEVQVAHRTVSLLSLRCITGDFAMWVGCGGVCRGASLPRLPAVHHMVTR